MTPTDELIMNSKYKNSPRLYFGKILDNFLVNPKPEYGFFQKALTSAMPIFLYKVFLTKSVRGFSVTGVITIPATPVVVIPIIHPASQPIGGLITNTLIPPFRMLKWKVHVGINLVFGLVFLNCYRIKYQTRL